MFASTFDHTPIAYCSSQTHWRHSCPDRKIDCPGCQEQIYYRTLQTHTSETCPSITLTCPGGLYGCPVRSSRNELSIHTQVCVFAALAPIFSAQQKRIDEQADIQKFMTKRLSIMEKGFERLEALVAETTTPDLEEPSNSAEPGQIPYVLEARVQRQNQLVRREPPHSSTLR